MVYDAQGHLWIGELPLIVSIVRVFLSQCFHSSLFDLQVLVKFMDREKSCLVTLNQEQNKVMQAFPDNAFVEWLSHDQSVVIDHSFHLLTSKSSKSHGCHAEAVLSDADATNNVLQNNNNNANCRADNNVSLTLGYDIVDKLKLLVEQVDLISAHTVIKPPNIVLQNSVFTFFTKDTFTHCEHQLLLVNDLTGINVLWVYDRYEIFLFFIVWLVLSFNHSGLLLFHLHKGIQEYSLVL